MCCLCFDRFEIKDLNIGEEGKPEDICKKCAEQEKTMDTKERLTCIRARCVEFLAIAEKRTKGKWCRKWDDTDQVTTSKGEIICVCHGAGEGSYLSTASVNDSKFIASCACAAEAGCRSTIAAIDCILRHEFLHEGKLESEILSAWADKLL